MYVPVAAVEAAASIEKPSLLPGVRPGTKESPVALSPKTL